MPDETTISVTRNELPLALTRKEGARIVTRWLQEARVGRDTAQFALPPSQAQIGAGDVLALTTSGNTSLYRIDRIEEAGLRLAEATRVDAAIDRAQSGGEETVALQPFVGPIPAEILFLDWPLLTGDEVPHAPYVAVTGKSWPGPIALCGAPQDSDYALLETLGEAAIIGVTQTALGAGPVGIWDRRRTRSQPCQWRAKQCHSRRLAGRVQYGRDRGRVGGQLGSAAISKGRASVFKPLCAVGSAMRAIRQLGCDAAKLVCGGQSGGAERRTNPDQPAQCIVGHSPAFLVRACTTADDRPQLPL